MKSLNVLCSLIFLICVLRETKANEAISNGVYIVYMGAAATSRNHHSLLLNSLVERKRDAVVHNYKNSFLGFAAHLTERDANDMARKPGVVSVFPDPLLKLHTTRSWDFLNYQTGVETKFRRRAKYNISTSNAASDVIIGVMDTGIWPESESFSDEGFGPIPSKWKGTCMQTKDFTAANCNRKLIGARYYKALGAFNSPRDHHGHGTHVASTAAGNAIHKASYYGLAMGSARGGFPGSRIASYRVCGATGCQGSNILAAFDDAIEDGVDVISLSLGASAGNGPNFHKDPVAIGAFHATEKGITVVCSGGNDGPSTGSVVNISPWILTVAATSIDRHFQADIILGDKTVIKGGGINFGELLSSPVYPLIYGNSAKRNSSNYDVTDARNCNPQSLDKHKVNGSIVICEDEEGVYSAKQKLAGVRKLGAVGMVFVSDDAGAVDSFYGLFPMTTVYLEDGKKIISYAKNERDPSATILPTVSVIQYKPAPVVPNFSGRGPSFATKDILKPDVAAPGVAILASWPDHDSEVQLDGKNPPHFYILSGTSMACPHVSGLAAMIKSQNPSWSPSAIRSAIMTTATQTNNNNNPITTTTTGTPATPYDLGAGELSTNPSHPGLIYETTTTDYLLFLCSLNYTTTTIKQITSTFPANFTCPTTPNSISSINYPSIAVSRFDGEMVRVKRTVTNVGEFDSGYNVSVNGSGGLVVEVDPRELRFSEGVNELSYEVSFIGGGGGVSGDYFGAVVWWNHKYRVRIPFVVTENS